MQASVDHDLERFILAQDRYYEQALRELEQGKKQSHWMWFIFPQASGLGSSAESVEYSIKSVSEAKAYLAHPLLGLRLQNMTAVTLQHRHRSSDAVFGEVDSRKFCSSMTLFCNISKPPSVYATALDVFFASRHDQYTLDWIQRN